MTRNRTIESPQATPDAVNAAIRRAHLLRSRALGAFLSGLAEKTVGTIARWNNRQALSRRLHELPDYILKDIGIGRDQIPSLVSNTLRRDPLSLSPTGNHPARAPWRAASPISAWRIPTAVNSNARQEDSTAA